jgi:hypothetical protein
MDQIASSTSNGLKDNNDSAEEQEGHTGKIIKERTTWLLHE